MFDRHSVNESDYALSSGVCRGDGCTRKVTQRRRRRRSPILALLHVSDGVKKRGGRQILRRLKSLGRAPSLWVRELDFEMGAAIDQKAF